MTRKKIVFSILLGAAVAGAAVYLLGTDSGKKELKRLKKTGKDVADPFKTFGKELVKNVKDVRKEERKRALKNYLHNVMEGAGV